MEEKEEISKKEAIHCLPELGGPATPWLIYPNGNTSRVFCNIIEPEKTCIKRIPQMRRKFCLQSSHGWLVLVGVSSCSRGCSLWNPVSSETIHLPDVKWKQNFSGLPKGCTLSSAPTEPGCMILFFCLNNLIIYCQPGDKQWTEQTYESGDGGGFGCIIGAIGFPDGTIYAHTDENHTVIIDRDSSGCLSFRLLNLKDRPGMLHEMAWAISYFVESCGELFCVYLYLPRSTNEIKCIKVYKLDFSKMAWVKVECLGGRVFFLNFELASSVSCFADQQSGLEGDCIYFTILQDKRLYVFDMKDDSISVSLPWPDLRTCFSCPLWFIPMKTNRMVDTTNHIDGRTITNDTKIMVKQSSKEMAKGEEKVEIIHDLFFNLPKELQHLIPTHLTSVVDYMNFRATCKPLRSIAPPVRWRSPWLSVIRKGVSFFFDPMCNSIYQLNTPELLSATIRFSKDGWFLMSKGRFRMFFFDPFTKTKIKLPHLPAAYTFEGICFSSVPTSSDCVVFGIGIESTSTLKVSWYRLGREGWSYKIINFIGEQPFMVSRNNPVFYDGAFYCLSHEGWLGVFNANKIFKVLLNSHPCSSTSQNFMVECEGDLLSVFIDEGGNATIISRFDPTMMCWVEVKSLSDKMLFLSPLTSMAVQTQEKRLQNKIFLPRVWSKKKKDVVFYSLETEKYHTFSSSSFSSCNFYGSKEQMYCSWFQPNLVWRSIP